MSLPEIFQQLLAGTMGRQVRQKVVDIAQEQWATKQAAAAAAISSPCDVAVVCALDIEAGALENLLKRPTTLRGDGFHVRLGDLAGRHMAVIRSGPGAKAARRATLAAIDGHTPQWVISAGFAGALHPDLRRGDIVVANRLIDELGQPFAIDQRVSDELLQNARVHVGPFLTAEHIVCQSEQKRVLGKKHGAWAVEMESLAVAEACCDRGVRLLAIRAVTDAMDESLPSDVEHLMRQPNFAKQAGAALGTIFRRPGSFNDLLNLRDTAWKCSERLAKFLTKLIRQLP